MTHATATRGANALRDSPRDTTTPSRPAPGREQPRLRAAPPVPVAAPRAPFVALVLVMVVAGVVGILVLNTKINENAFQLTNLEAQQVTLDQQEQQLNQQLADRESPNNLAAEALKLGLVPAGTPAFIRLPDGRVLGVPQPATSAPSITSQADTPSAAPSGQ
ncbi:MAG: hypothetical protein J2P15_01590 [Micromonosporaceae bacterium]|nr:hypothetical protein [Micromonosporaceae bacterium]